MSRLSLPNPSRPYRPRPYLVAVSLAGSLALALAACGGGAGSPSAGKATTGRPVAGGTATMAEGPLTQPTYIFPLVSAQNSSAANIEQFQQLMYLPLYWYGNNESPTVDYNDSLGNPPVFSNGDRTVTITLKPYHWSDGEPVTSRDVVFWINLLKANATEYYGYVSGYFPDNVRSVDTPNARTVVLHLNKGYNPRWFLYNQLSLISPLPLAWDRTSLSSPAPRTSSAHLPDTTVAGAHAVYRFLNGQAKKLRTWATSPVWSVVDGPWKLKAFTPNGQATFVPNRKYSGTPKPRLAKFVELPFTNDVSEVSAVRSGGPNGVTLGYIPPEDLPSKASVLQEGYRLSMAYAFAWGYFPLNLNNPRIGPVFRQVYFRQALQHLVNQTKWSQIFYHGAAAPTYGPVPLKPANSLSDPIEHHNPFPFSIRSAVTMLAAHGWKVRPGGLTTCTRPGSGPGECGTGIRAGLGISFSIDYTAGNAALDDSMRDLASTAAQAGIRIHLGKAPYATVVSGSIPCKSSQSDCNWTAQNWGGGWTYYPDTYPSGEELVETGAAANYESYSDSKADQLIIATTRVGPSQSQEALDRYQNYLERQLPVVFTPEEAGDPIQGFPAIVSQRLGGYSPNAYQGITPAAWYLRK